MPESAALPTPAGIEPYATGAGWAIYCADNREAAAAFHPGAFQAMCTDPPYGLRFMGRRWDYHVPDADQWRALIRILVPGAHIAAFGGPRTYHRAVVALEDAGAEIRDQLAWIFGQGFPKSIDVGKALDAAAGAEREPAGTYQRPDGKPRNYGAWDCDNLNTYHPCDQRAAKQRTAPATDQARRWDGFGTALKPAHEPIVLARRPLAGRIADNVRDHGAGALNIDACRVPFASLQDEHEAKAKNQFVDFGTGPRSSAVYGQDRRNRPNYNAAARWPANVLHDGSDEVLDVFPEARSAYPGRPDRAAAYAGHPCPHVSEHLPGLQHAGASYSDRGSAARFFYCAKASSRERGANNRHPTVKPLALMRWLVRLITPPEGVLIDPWCGSGSTGLAAIAEGIPCVLIDEDESAVAIAAERLRAAELETGT